MFLSWKASSQQDHKVMFNKIFRKLYQNITKIKKFIEYSLIRNILIFTYIHFYVYRVIKASNVF